MNIHTNTNIIYNEYRYDISTFDMSITGMPIKISENNYLKGSTGIIQRIGEYVQNSPFLLHSSYKSSDNKTSFVTFNYDSNMNMVTFNNFDLNETRSYNYLSYDETGNWTQCIVIEKNTHALSSNVVWKMTRDITYW